MWSNGELHYKSAAHIVTGYFVLLKMHFNNAGHLFKPLL